MMKINNLRKKLTEMAFNVTQNSHTEPPNSGKYNDFFEKGIYLCICCNEELFHSKDKFKSPSGWPSFKSAIKSHKLSYIQDKTYNMLRTEVKCKNCDAHLGHVFYDEPEPNQQRYCINSVALDFQKK
ncbi:MAG: peptide-methionine (R)-S-oxide reductase [Rickettsiales bacterium]|nr:peptide-methionine (R)-S-oxide reductase [Rickettsiales bacterium]